MSLNRGGGRYLPGGRPGCADGGIAKIMELPLDAMVICLDGIPDCLPSSRLRVL